MKKLSNFLYFFITFLLLSYSNLYISNLLYYKVQNGYDLKSFIFKITFVKNTGAAFSIMQNSRTFLILLSMITLFLIFIYIFHKLSFLSKKTLLALAFLASGILGNMLERIELGYVRDFFELTFCRFPIFNISDIFITIGVIGLIYKILFSRKPIKLL